MRQKKFLIPGTGLPLAAALTAALLACSPGAFAQNSPKEVRAAANTALAQGEFGAAIEYLELYISYLGSSTKPQVVRSLEPIYYNLGVCFFFTAQFPEAEKAFEDYCKRYPKGYHFALAKLYLADSLRLQGRMDAAINAYIELLKKFKKKYTRDQLADIRCSLARCYISQDKWSTAQPYLVQVFLRAPDAVRRNWAAAMWTIACLKADPIELSNVFKLNPMLLGRDSFASRSVALNMSLLEAGDTLFSDEKFREALWIYRMVYSQDLLALNSERYLTKLKRRAERLRRRSNALRQLMRVQENIGETEAEIKALDEIKNYDIELSFRIARSYMEIARYREAYELFYHLHGITKDKLAEEALYLAFSCALKLRPWDKAFKRGAEYMEKYPAGEYYDPLTLAVGQLHARLMDWPKLISHFEQVLRVSPKHEDGAECRFLLGYALFMEEDFADGVKWLREMNTKFPGNPRQEDGMYWIGMGLIFDREYEDGGIELDALLDQYPESSYREDAAFRRGVCDYGLSDYASAEARFNKFVANHPESKLLGEAYIMLADIAANKGELKKAVELFQAAMEHELNIEQYNYAAFKSAEIMFDDLKDYDAVIAHFEGYIADGRDGLNMPQAIFYIGRGLWNKEEKKAALDRYMDAIITYGNDPDSLGVDMVLEEWCGKAKSLDKDERFRAWVDLKKAIQKAGSRNKRPLALRLKRIQLYNPDATEEENRKIIEELLDEKILPFVGPSTLEVVIDEAWKQYAALRDSKRPKTDAKTAFMNDRRDLAAAAAEETLKRFAETDYGLAARMFLARQAMEDGKYEIASVHLGVIREVFATQEAAAEALLLLGEVNMRQKKYDEADECYKSILAVKQWKGPLFPKALIGRGECAMAKKRYAKACAYFERVYLMYSHYKTGAAKAYLLRAECLDKLREYRKSFDTLKEMLCNRNYVDLPEYQEGLKMMAAAAKRVGVSFNPPDFSEPETAPEPTTGEGTK